MLTKTTDAADRPGLRLFRVERVEKSPSPEGGEDQGWHRYVLDNGASTIVGHRRGKLRDVTAYAREYVKQLNERSATGRSPSSPRGRKPAQAVKTKTSPK